MFGRLKSLPLTIVLTILIWMYAEAEFSSTQEGVPVRIQFQSSDPAHFSVRAIDENGAAFRNMDITITLQGAKEQTDAIVRQARTSGGAFTTLIVTRDPHTISDGDAGTVIQLAPALSQLPVFHDKGVVVVAALPERVRLQKRGLETFLPSTPIRVEIKGSPEVVSPIFAAVTPSSINIAATGTPEAIAKLRAAMARPPGTATDDMVCAYVDIAAEDRPNDKPISKRVRYYVPDGITLDSKVDTVEVRLTPARP